jgi:hypothetical protein
MVTHLDVAGKVYYAVFPMDASFFCNPPYSFSES